MTATVKHLVDSFDALPESEKREAVVEILRRYGSPDGDMPEVALTELADELFLALDTEEDARATR